MEGVSGPDLSEAIRQRLGAWLGEVCPKIGSAEQYHVGRATYRILASDYMASLCERCLLLGLTVEALEDGRHFTHLWYPIRGGLRIRFHNISLYILFNKIARNAYRRLCGGCTSWYYDPFFLLLEYDRLPQEGYALEHRKCIPKMEALLEFLLSSKSALTALSDELDAVVVAQAKEEKIRSLFLKTIPSVVATFLNQGHHVYSLQLIAHEALLSFRLQRKKRLTLALSTRHYMDQLHFLPSFVDRCKATASWSEVESLVQMELPYATLRTYGNNHPWVDPSKSLS